MIFLENSEGFLIFVENYFICSFKIWVFCDILDNKGFRLCVILICIVVLYLVYLLKEF